MKSVVIAFLFWSSVASANIPTTKGSGIQCQLIIQDVDMKSKKVHWADVFMVELDDQFSYVISFSNGHHLNIAAVKGRKEVTFRLSLESFYPLNNPQGVVFDVVQSSHIDSSGNFGADISGVGETNDNIDIPGGGRELRPVTWVITARCRGHQKI